MQLAGGTAGFRRDAVAALLASCTAIALALAFGGSSSPPAYSGLAHSGSYWPAIFALTLLLITFFGLPISSSRSVSFQQAKYLFVASTVVSLFMPPVIAVSNPTFPPPIVGKAALTSPAHQNLRHSIRTFQTYSSGFRSDQPLRIR
jgi:F0F1-type ATP synthase assembly protein I